MPAFSAQDFHLRYKPKKCDLRVYLREIGITEAESSEFEQVLLRLGLRYEQQHLHTFPPSEVANLGTVEPCQRFDQTRALVEAQHPLLYQPELRCSLVVNGNACDFVGVPDFLIRDGEGYVIRDVKMARRVDAKNHPEILFQLQFYGWLYERVFGRQPVRLEVLNGRGDLVPVPNDHAAMLVERDDILRIKTSAREFYEPVGWTKCTGCGFHDRCRPRAEATSDVSVVYGVDQGAAKELHNRGVENIGQLLEQFNASRLSEMERPWGKRTQRVGVKAEMILSRAEVLRSGEERLLSVPVIQQSDHYVMFDLEGMPPHLDELDKIYLWGTQVFGNTNGDYMPAVAGFGEDGDRDGWNQFLANAAAIFQQFGDIPFVHWHHYERTHIDEYIERYGDPQDVAERVLGNLVDLLPITRDNILLPLSSYSLKVVERHVRFQRTQEEFGGSWSMARYIEATETRDAAMRQQVMDQILIYNREDLEAMWAVFQWLRRRLTELRPRPLTRQEQADGGDDVDG